MEIEKIELLTKIKSLIKKADKVLTLNVNGDKARTLRLISEAHGLTFLLADGDPVADHVYSAVLDCQTHCARKDQFLKSEAKAALKRALSAARMAIVAEEVQFQ